jgi:hypothetical protein
VIELGDLLTLPDFAEEHIKLLALIIMQCFGQSER